MEVMKHDRTRKGGAKEAIAGCGNTGHERSSVLGVFSGTFQCRKCPGAVSWLPDRLNNGAFSQQNAAMAAETACFCVPYSSPVTVAGPLRTFTAFLWPPEQGKHTGLREIPSISCFAFFQFCQSAASTRAPSTFTPLLLRIFLQASNVAPVVQTSSRSRTRRGSSGAPSLME